MRRISLEQFYRTWDGPALQTCPQRPSTFRIFTIQFLPLFTDLVTPDFHPIHPGIFLYYLYGFLEHRQTHTFLYWALPDVTYFPNDWHERVLIRTAAHPRDFLGGISTHTALESLRTHAIQLLHRPSESSP